MATPGFWRTLGTSSFRGPYGRWYPALSRMKVRSSSLSLVPPPYPSSYHPLHKLHAGPPCLPQHFWPSALTTTVPCGRLTSRGRRHPYRCCRWRRGPLVLASGEGCGCLYMDKGLGKRQSCWIITGSSCALQPSPVRRAGYLQPFWSCVSVDPTRWVTSHFPKTLCSFCSMTQSSFQPSH